MGKNHALRFSHGFRQSLGASFLSRSLVGASVMTSIVAGVVGLNASYALAAPVKDFSARAEVTRPTRLWTEPTKFGEPIAALEPGLKLNVENYSTTGSWVKVTTPGGREGWVPARHTDLADSKRYGPSNRKEKFDVNGERVPASSDEAASEAAPAGAPQMYVSGNASFGKQLTPASAYGFGLGATAGYFVRPRFAPGLWLSYDRFSDTAEDSVNKVSKKTTRYFLGPNLRFQQGHFAIDASLGLDIVKTTFKISGPIATGSQICPASSSETALGFNLRPAFWFPLGATTQLELFASYGVGFHGGRSCASEEKGSAPQQISSGVAITVPL